jgi:hypothetical protein
MKKKITKFPLLKPDLQLSFYHRLQTFQHSYLAEALRSTVEKLDISKLDKELAKYVDTVSLKKLASFGIRAEVVFPVPYLLSSRPSLVGYYRLLFGFSQKEFYRVPGMSKFKRLEERNLISEETIPILPAFCQSLSQTASYMLEGGDVFSLRTVRDLQLLTLGAQLRGGQNTKLGKDAAAEVFSLIEKIIHDKLIEENPRKLVLINAAGRKVTVAFSADPDIAITESLASDIKPKVSIEIKGGTDISNIHNRIGEAEKSHQKAKARGFLNFGRLSELMLTLKRLNKSHQLAASFFFSLNFVIPRVLNMKSSAIKYAQ